MVGSLNSYLDQLLNIHWLRPETALWRSFDCLLMEKYGKIDGQSADLGCGDGTMSFIMAPHNGSRRYLNYLDRGYAGLIHHCLDFQAWSALFQAGGFTVADHHRYLSDAVTDIWNIGTRPIAPLLIQMAGRLSETDRADLKSEWVDYFTKFFTPILEGEFDRALAEEEAGFHFFVLEKS